MKKYESLFETNIYRFDGEKSILEDKDLGICTDIASVLTPGSYVTVCDCFQGCPYTDTGFHLDIITDGERRVKTQKWVWLPNAMLRTGSTDNFDIESITAVIPGTRAFVLKITYKSKSDEDITVPLQAEYRSNPRKESNWKFSIPEARLGKLSDYYEVDGCVFCETDTAKVCMKSSVENMKMFPEAYLWEGEITIPAGGEKTGRERRKGAFCTVV